LKLPGEFLIIAAMRREGQPVEITSAMKRVQARVEPLRSNGATSDEIQRAGIAAWKLEGQRPLKQNELDKPS
jgi:hypothetical protein